MEETYQDEDVLNDDDNKQDDKPSFWILKKRKLKLGSSIWTMSTPEPQEIFCQVQGRMPSCMNEKPKEYVITNQEMNRRVNGPQQLNSSSVASLLRRTKIKNCGGQMRAQLEEAGIHCQMSSHQEVQPCKVLSFCESEALHFARDLNTICEKSYPAKEVAREVMEESQKEFDTRTAVNNHGQDLVDCLDALGYVFDSVVPPITSIESVASEDKDLNRCIEQLACGTHGFAATSNLIWHKQLSEIGKSISTENS